MAIDDVLFMTITAGIVLTGFYLQAEYVWHRRISVAERGRELAQRALHSKRVRAASRVLAERSDIRRIGFTNA
jgi:hypothetical protein